MEAAASNYTDHTSKTRTAQRSKHTRRFYRERHEEGRDIAGVCINTLERFTRKRYNGHARKLPIKFRIISFSELLISLGKSIWHRLGGNINNFRICY